MINESTNQNRNWYYNDYQLSIQQLSPRVPTTKSQQINILLVNFQAQFNLKIMSLLSVLYCQNHRTTQNISQPKRYKLKTEL